MLVGWARVVNQWGRSLAMGLSVVLAVTSFLVLTASATTSKLQTTQTVDANFRSSYDILVRPQGSQTELEAREGVVRPNYLSGIYGGITSAELNRVKRVVGVEVAAPIAMIGQVLETTQVPVDVTRYVGDDGRRLLRYQTTYISRNGAASVVGQSGYVYVTPKALNQVPPFGDGPYGPAETHPFRKPVLVCPQSFSEPPASSPFAARQQWTSLCWSRFSGLNGEEWSGLGERRYAALVQWSFPVTLAAIDPQAEAALAGVDEAIVDGRYLEPTDVPVSDDLDGVAVPVIASSRPIVDEQAQITFQTLPRSYAKALAGGLSKDHARKAITQASGRTVGTATVTAAQAYRQWRNALDVGGGGVEYIDTYWTAGPVRYRRNADGDLAPRTVSNPATVWQSAFRSGGYVEVPADAADTSFRPLSRRLGISEGASFELPSLDVVGSFDPTLLKGFSALSEVPLETYRAPEVTAADEPTRELLGDEPLLPDLNPAGYLQAPPLMLTTLASLPAFTNEAVFRPQTSLGAETTSSAAPISVIRIRVDGVTGTDPASRERIRLVAEKIQKATGLDVDITIGSSPAPTIVALPPSRHGSPAMRVTENWVKKGVTTALITAIDRKSAVLFVLVLLSCGLVVANAANASVRSRRIELGVLACLGWRASTLYRSVGAELALIGSLAGVAGALLAIPTGIAVGSHVSTGRALLALPAALLLVLVAGVIPAGRAARADPGDAVRPAVTAVHRTMKLRGVASMVAASVARTPARAIAGAASLALGVAPLTILLSVIFAFNGDVVGTLLGEAVAVQVRTPDLVAAGFMALLGLVALADILYLDIREQAPHYAALQASGWIDSALLRLVVGQAAVIATMGAIAGAGVGLAVVNAIATVNSGTVVVAIIVALGGVILACLTALIPAARLRRLPTAQLLAQE